MDVKKTVKVLLKCLACLILLAGVSLGGFFLGKATVPRPLSWTETEVFVATVVDYQGDSLLVQGSPINDEAHQGQFSFSTKGVPLWWHGISLSFADLKPGHTLKIIYDKTAQEPGSTVLAHVLYVGGMDHEL